MADAVSFRWSELTRPDSPAFPAMRERLERQGYGVQVLSAALFYVVPPYQPMVVVELHDDRQADGVK